MRIFLLLSLFTALSINLFAQKGKIEGKVTDAKSGLSLSGVTISVDGENAKG